MKGVAILGSTGSIGRSTLDVVSSHPDKFRVVALAAGKNIQLLAQQAREFSPDIISVANPQDLPSIRNMIGSSKVRIAAGSDGLSQAATHPDVEIVLTAMVGSAGLAPTWEAIRAKKNIALANKETMVCAGALIMSEVKKQGVALLPVDSEHCAIFQCLKGYGKQEAARIILTASGGPFRRWTREKMNKITPEQALDHPTWNMGAKITIDSATLMNKGLEVIEARWLFDIPPERIAVVVHPESIVHSMVEFVDGQVLAQLGVPDMKAPIAYALSYPDRLTNVVDRLSLPDLGTLHFEDPDTEKFPCLSLAYKALTMGGTAPASLNAANEIAVDAFLNEKISYFDIAAVVEKVLSEVQLKQVDSIETVLAVDHEVREIASSVIDEMKKES